MGTQGPRAPIVADHERLVLLVGGYGSGKTEVSVNLALELAASGERIQLADLDLVNPYFRSREVRGEMEARGIRVVVPPGDQAWADLPILLPEVRGMLHPPVGVRSLFDVGGDDVGARALASLRPSLGLGRYELWQVVNARRPFQQTVAGCLALRDGIEHASRFSVTGFVANTHLLEHTTAHDVLEGWQLARALSDATGLPVRAVTAMGDLADVPAIAALPVPVLRLRRRMLPPWLARGGAAAPAGRRALRVGPPGRPPTLRPPV